MSYKKTMTTDEEEGSVKQRLAQWEAPPPPPGYHATCAALGAELVGAALLTALPALPAPAALAALAVRALTAGLVLLMLVQCFDHISGALLNPAVTLAAGVAGRVSRRALPALVGAQLLGAAAAPALALLLAPDPGLTPPAPTVPLLQAAGLEALGAACLTLASCASWDPRTSARAGSWPLRAGATLAALTLAVGERTGANFNPARSLSLALWAADFTHQWVYCVSPLVGALSAALLYVALWGAPAPAPAPRGAPAPAPAPALR